MSGEIKPRAIQTFESLSALTQSLESLEIDGDHVGYVAPGHIAEAEFLRACVEYDQWLNGKCTCLYEVSHGYGKWGPSAHPEINLLSWSWRYREGYEPMTQAEVIQ